MKGTRGALNLRNGLSGSCSDAAIPSPIPGTYMETMRGRTWRVAHRSAAEQECEYSHPVAELPRDPELPQSLVP